MSMNAEERKAVVEFRLEKAQRAYEQACGVVEKIEPVKQLIQEVSTMALKRINE